jgi:hypothetical protein
VATDRTYTDQRVVSTLVLYPKPFEIQAEYNIGKGPEFNPATDSIEVRNLQGGYTTLSYLLKKGSHTLIPFARMQQLPGK